MVGRLTETEKRQRETVRDREEQRQTYIQKTDRETDREKGRLRTVTRPGQNAREQTSAMHTTSYVHTVGHNYISNNSTHSKS